MPSFSPAVLETLKEATDQGFWLIDANGLTLDVNPAMCRLLGRPSTDIIGATIFDFVDEENAAIFHREIAQRRQGKKGKYELALQQPDGSNRPCLNSAVAVHDENGERIGSVGIWTDITELKRVQHELDTARTLLEERVSARTAELAQTEQALFKSQDVMRDFAECSSDWFWETDVDMRFTYISERIRDVTGYGPEHFLGQTRSQIAARKIDEESFATYMQALEDREPFRDFEYEITSVNDERLTVSVSGVPVFDAHGEFSGYRGSVSNVTERVRVESARDEALRVAEAANLSKTAFLASMSHEIRTPMTGILGLTDILLEQKFTPETSNIIGKIKGATLSLLNIINDVLDLSKIEAGRMEIELKPVDPKLIALEIAALLEPSTNTKDISLDLEFAPSVPDLILSDATRLRQVLMNLIGNAVKFTLVGGVTVRMAVTNDRISIEIEDTGIGIDEEMLPRLFDEFEQAEHGVTRNFEGTGLGLAISRKLVRLMGGDIWATSTFGEGSTFFVKLPARRPDGADLPSAASKAPVEIDVLERSLHILLVDDNDLNRMVVRALLDKHGHSYDEAVNGREAVDMSMSQDYDLILMDIRMPEMSGQEATRAIRAAGSGNAAKPIIALTADVVGNQFAEYKEAGMDHMVGKPIDAREFYRVIAAAVSA